MMERTDRERVAKKIAARILDKGLSDSTWRSNHPEAYEDLLELRLDFEMDAAEVLRKEKVA